MTVSPSLTLSSPSSIVSSVFLATERSASSGHSAKKSIVQLLTSDGKLRSRERKASPSGDMQMHRWRLSRTRLTNVLYIATLVSGVPAACAIGRIALMIWPTSLSSRRLGTSPVLRMLLRSSRKDSLTICVSVKRNICALPSMPEPSSSFLRSSFHSALPYVLVISIWKQSNDDMDAASRESDWRPEPPTPASSALPKGSLITRSTRQMCSIAKGKSTSSMGVLEMALKSSSMVLILLVSASMSESCR
mmetsp:Transcript_61286/g.162228  ORF Transcript_61286/g.162228 Transcript_61286/m.162228 type:complete len:248 (-) Transcript_61286:144-887(-)